MAGRGNQPSLHYFVRTEIVAKYVASVIKNDVEDNVKTVGVRFVNETAKLLLRELGIGPGGGGVRGEARVNSEEVLDAVTVMRLCSYGTFFENRSQPDGACAKRLDVSELLAHSLQRTPP